MQQDVTFLTQLYKLLAWYEANRKQVAVGAVVVAVVVLVGGYYFWNLGEKEVNAGEALSQVTVQAEFDPDAARNVADGYQKVAADYAGTKAAGQALLEAGVALYSQGNFDQAQALFQRVVSEYSDSVLSPQAQLGIAACLDAQGKQDDAVAAYQRVIQVYADSNVVGQAKFAKARILESQGKLADASSLYEDIVHVYGLNSSIGSEAGMRGDEVKRRIMSTGNAPIAAASVTPAAPSFSPADFARSLTNLSSAKTTNTY